MVYSGARGTLIYEKNLKLKFSCQTPFKQLIIFISQTMGSVYTQRWVAELGGWVAKLVAWCLLRQLSGLESRHLSKIQNGRHKAKGRPTHSSPTINTKKDFQNAPQSNGDRSRRKAVGRARNIQLLVSDKLLLSMPKCELFMTSAPRELPSRWFMGR